MFQKCSLFIKGFMRMSTMIIILIILVTYYFYQDKIREVSGRWYENNKQGGALYYVNGFWDGLKSAQKLQDDRSGRALELVGNAKKVSDKNGLYSFDVPQSWNVSADQGSTGSQLSKIVVTSPTFFQKNDDSGTSYENGAQLTVQIVRGELPAAKLSDGGHGKMLIRKGSVDQGGVIQNFYAYRDPKVKSGELLDVNFVHGGNTYIFSFVFNPSRFTGGEYSFQNILGSVNFSENK